MSQETQPLTNADVRYMIGVRYRALRVDLETSQTEMAKLIGIPRSTLSSIERGKMLPNLILANTLCKYYKAPLDFLFSGRGLNRKLNSKWGTLAQRSTPPI